MVLGSRGMDDDGIIQEQDDKEEDPLNKRSEKGKKRNGCRRPPFSKTSASNRQKEGDKRPSERAGLEVLQT